MGGVFAGGIELESGGLNQYACKRMKTDHSSGPQTTPEVSSGSSPQVEEPSSVVAAEEGDKSSSAPREVGGRKGPDPTRFGDWEKNGRCIDF